MLFLKDNPNYINEIASSISSLRKRGYEITIVASGAIGLAINELGLKSKPTSKPKKQALAAYGQSLLVETWKRALLPFNTKVAQVLLTYDVMENRERFVSAKACFATLKNYGFLPIVNENDTIRCDEIDFGDNDNLSVFTSLLIDAKLVVLFTDTNGVFNSNPHHNKNAVRIPIIERVDQRVFSLVQEKFNPFSTGGMAAKLASCNLASSAGIGVVITKIAESRIESILGGDDVGTYIVPQPCKLKDRKKWLFINKKIKGRVVVDDGAKDAIVASNKSLLSSGVLRVENEFSSLSIVGVADKDGQLFARGIALFSNDQLQRLIQEKGSIPKHSKVVIDRNNLILV